MTEAVYVPSHTARQVWKTCNRKYYYAYVLGLEPDAEDAQGRRMGKAFASLLDTGESGYAELIGAAVDQAQADRLCEEQIVVEELVRGYRAKYGERDEGIQTEVGFDSPVLGRGFLDGLSGVRGKEDKLLTKWWQTESQDTDALLEQVTAYFAAMQEAGTPLEVIEYRTTWKPKLLKRTDGKWFRKKGQTLDEYRASLQASIEASPEDYYTSKDYYRSQEQIDDFLLGVAVTNHQIQYSLKLSDACPDRAAAYPQSTGACVGKYGRCEFADLCLKGELALPGYRQRERSGR